MNPTRRQRLLVIGANGFIGGAIVRACVDRDLAVAAYTRRPIAEQPPAASARITQHLGGLTPADPPRLEEAMRDADVVVHAAGLAHRTRGVTEAQFREVNVEGVRVVIDAAARARVPHVVLISSVAVYGAAARQAASPYPLPRGGGFNRASGAAGRSGGSDSSPDALPEALRDEDAPCAPATAYARSKLEGEQVATALADRHGLRLTIVRPATVFGAGDPGSVAQLARLLRANRFLWIGAGTNRKSLTHVDDLAAAVVRLAFAPDEGSGSGKSGGARREAASTGPETYNIAGPPVSMRDIVETLSDALGRRSPRIGVPERIARFALRVTAPLAHRGRPAGGLLRWAPDRLSAWLSDDVYAAAKYEARFGPVSRMDWREGLRREAAWLVASAPARAGAARHR
jgi:nucleoside-diphosphate-sugar epimerase